MIFGRSRPRAAVSPVRERAGAEVGARLAADPAVVPVAVPGMQFFYRPGFLDESACDALVAMIDAKRRPSTLLSDGADPGFRTSDSCDMDRWSDAVRPIDESIAVLLGLPSSRGETMQGQRYAPGQHFRAHHDYFHQGSSYWPRMMATGGQRTWTAMIYLNDVEEGGATWFPQAGIKISPQRGLLLAWNNMSPDGSPNELTLHEGMPVVAGVKYIITKWFREGDWIQ